MRTQHGSPVIEQRHLDDTVDRALLAAISNERDTAAMEQFYNRFRHRLTPFLRRLTLNENIIEESYNDVMLKVWRKAHQYRGNSLVSSWVFSIGYRTCLRTLKKDQRHDHEDIEHYQLIEMEKNDKLDNAKIVKRGIAQLSPAHRMVIELSYFQGYSTAEIAAIIGKPVNTIKTRLHHARLKVRAQLDGENFSYEQ